MRLLMRLEHILQKQTQSLPNLARWPCDAIFRQGHNALLHAQKTRHSLSADNHASRKDNGTNSTLTYDNSQLWDKWRNMHKQCITSDRKCTLSCVATLASHAWYATTNMLATKQPWIPLVRTINPSCLTMMCSHNKTIQWQNTYGTSASDESDNEQITAWSKWIHVQLIFNGSWAVRNKHAPRNKYTIIVTQVKRYRQQTRRTVIQVTIK
jgi:hypothetical protein